MLSLPFSTALYHPSQAPDEQLDLHLSTHPGVVPLGHLPPSL